MSKQSCSCGNASIYAHCCGRYLDGLALAPTAVALMRSRYTAYTLLREAYLLATWHPSTRPDALNLNHEPPCKWRGLSITQQQQATKHASVTFTARYKINGRTHRLHEISQFIFESGQWWYVTAQ